MLGPLVYTDPDGRRYRVLGGRYHRPVGYVVWTPPPNFYAGLRSPARREEADLWE